MVEAVFTCISCRLFFSSPVVLSWSALLWLCSFYSTLWQSDLSFCNSGTQSLQGQAVGLWLPLHWRLGTAYRLTRWWGGAALLFIPAVLMLTHCVHGGLGMKRWLRGIGVVHVRATCHQIFFHGFCPNSHLHHFFLAHLYTPLLATICFKQRDVHMSGISFHVLCCELQ